MKNLSLPFEQLRNDGLALIQYPSRDPSNTSYKKAYPVFLKFFADRDVITTHDFVIASHYVYGWMPTVLTLYEYDEKTILTILNQVKQGSLLTVEEIKTLTRCINNSLVGTSKLIHCISPSLYPIRDSHILRYCTGKKSSYSINDGSLYRSYRRLLETLTHHADYQILHSQIETRCGYQLTPMRAIELIMFETQKQRTARKQ